MRRVRLVLFTVAIGSTCFLGASAALVAAPGEPATEAPVPSLPENAAEIAEIAAGRLVLEPAPATAAPGALSPEMVEIEATLAAERERVSELTARLRAATDDAAALALEREIEATKQGAELAILGIQARHARAAGREEQAREIEETIAQMAALVNGTPAAVPITPAVPQAPRPAGGTR